jgi:hypothetical protein
MRPDQPQHEFLVARLLKAGMFARNPHRQRRVAPSLRKPGPLRRVRTDVWKGFREDFAFVDGEPVAAVQHRLEAGICFASVVQIRRQRNVSQDFVLDAELFTKRRCRVVDLAGVLAERLRIAR